MHTTTRIPRISGDRNGGAVGDRLRPIGALRTVRSIAALGAVLALLWAPLIPATGAHAAGETLEALLTQTDGTGVDDLDGGPNDGLVRTNDTVDYKVELPVNGADAENVTFTMTLPKGMVLEAAPAYCTGPGSGVTPAFEGLVPPVPLTAAYYTSLPQQTLVCNVGHRDANTNASYHVVPRVLTVVPNGTTLGPVSVTVASDNAGPVVSNELSVTAVSKMRWDLSKNGAVTQEDAGPVFGPQPTACPWDTSLGCMKTAYPILIGSDASGKGIQPIGATPVTFVDDLSPEALWPDLDPAQHAQINADPGAYGARIFTDSCSAAAIPGEVPGEKIGGEGGSTPDYTEENSVRDSGTITCSQPGGPGTPVQVSIENADYSLHTSPTNYKADGGGNGSAIPTDAAYAVSGQIMVYIPSAAIEEFGTEDGGVKTLKTRNAFSDFSATGLDGTVQSGEPEWNNYRTLQPNLRPPGFFDKYFAGNPFDRDMNTPSGVFSPWWHVTQGPPGNFTKQSGTINASPGQTVISQLVIEGSNATSPRDMTVLACDAWDNSKLNLHAQDYPGMDWSPADNPWSQRVGSDGEAVWLSGYNNPQTGDASLLPDYTVQYGNGAAGSGDASTCGDGDSPAGWFDDPADVPGNDAGLAADGIYTGVSRVRILVHLPEPDGVPFDSASVTTWAAVALRVAEGVPAGEVIPNWAAVMFGYDGFESRDSLLGHGSWSKSSYDPGTAIGNGHIGALGDRLISAPAFARIDKTVKGPHDADFGASTPSVTSGDTVHYRLSPSLTSAGIVQNVGIDVWVEDCLPTSVLYESASVDPDVISVGSTPDDARLEHDCASGETYLRWVLPGHVPNRNIAPIVVTAVVSALAGDGVYTNTAVVGAAGDSSPEELRTASADIQIQSPGGIRVEKQALTPVTQVNRAGQGTNETNRWLVSMASVNGDEATDPVFIDRLPAHGVDGSDFDGTHRFVSAEVRSGTGVVVEYTKSSGVDPDPTLDASVWCADVTSGGACPASAAEVTGLRISKPGAFPSGDLFSVEVTTVGVGNAADDVYANTIAGRVPELQRPVGPTTRTETVVASSVSGIAWWDENSDGERGAGEALAPGVTVTLSGVDDLGNTVSATTTTHLIDASYSFPGLRASGGDGYTVTFGKPAGGEFTVQDAADDDVDSDADRDTGEVLVPVAADTDVVHVDAGYLRPTPEPVVGSFKIVKQVEGPGSKLATGDFVFDVECTLDGSDDPVFEDTVTLTGTGRAGGETLESDVIDGLPAGAVCTIVEVATGGADDAPPPVQITIDADPQTVQIAGFVNAFSAGTIELAKALDGDGAEDPMLADLEFELTVTCQVEVGGERVDVYSGVVLVKAGQRVVLQVDGEPVLLPLGARCFAVETGTQGAEKAVVNHDSYENAAIVRKGTAGDPQVLLITATNTFEPASLTVLKKVEGPAPRGTEYTFELECTYPATDADGTLRNAPYPLPADDAKFTLKAGQSRTITVLAGVTCRVAETDVPDGATVIVKDSDGSTAGGDADGVLADIAGDENTVEVTNAFKKLTRTGTAGPLTAWALGAGLLAGAGALLLLRRRREASEA